MESASQITMNTNDFQLITSDTLNLISLTGDIRIGTSVDVSIIRSDGEQFVEVIDDLYLKYNDSWS